MYRFSNEYSYLHAPQPTDTGHPPWECKAHESDEPEETCDNESESHVIIIQL
jgi:hypothetical protein